MSEVLACVDFSDATGSVIAEAARHALLAGGSLHVLHVAAAESDLAGYDRGPVATHTRDERAGELRDEHAQLGELATKIEAEHDGVRVTPLLVMGSTVETIIAEADRLDAGVIVVGSHGHGALHHLLVGSICEGVLRHTRRPVVVVPVAKR